MGKINKKKINVADVFIIVILVIFIAGGISRLNKVNDMTVEKSEPFEIELLFEDKSIGFKNNVLVGDSLKDSVRGYEIGKITNVEIREHREMISSNEKIIYSVIPNKWDLYVKVKGNGLFDNDGVLIGSRRYFIGTETRIKSNMYVTTVEVIDLIKSEE